MKTIKQIADEIGVSKTAVRKKMPPEVRERHIETIDGIIYILPEGEQLIKQGFSNRIRNQSKPDSAYISGTFPGVSGNGSSKQFSEVFDGSGNSQTGYRNQLVSDDLIAVLREQLTVKDQQLKEKDSQIKEITAALENTTAALKAAQVLHAGTMNNKSLIVKAKKAEPEALAPERPEPKPPVTKEEPTKPIRKNSQMENQATDRRIHGNQQCINRVGH